MTAFPTSEARRHATAFVDLDLLAANYRALAAISGAARCAPVVKGDGYGLGMEMSARTCWREGARLMFVARFDDGARLREILPDAEIAVLDGLFGWDDEDFERERLLPVLCDAAQVRRWFAAPRAVKAFVHIDTAMNRLGLRPEDVAGVAPLLADRRNDIAGYLTHFASSDDADRALCRRQAARFRAAVAGLPAAPLSITNSSGLFLGDDFRADITRPGKALTGIDPVPAGAPCPVRPAMTVFAPILQVREMPAGESVGYSETWRSERPTRIATIGIGYANGYLRSLGNRGVIAIDGVRAPLVGRVSMDLVTADVTEVPEVALSSGIAEMVGPTVGLAEVARLANSNDHEVQIALGRGCRRIYRGEGAPMSSTA